MFLLLVENLNHDGYLFTTRCLDVIIIDILIDNVNKYYFSNLIIWNTFLCLFYNTIFIHGVEDDSRLSFCTSLYSDRPIYSPFLQTLDSAAIRFVEIHVARRVVCLVDRPCIHHSASSQIERIVSAK